MDGKVTTKTKTMVRVVKMGQSPKDIEFEGTGTVRDALAKAGLASQPIEKVRVNGEPVTLDTMLPTDKTAVLTLVTRVEGGR